MNIDKNWWENHPQWKNNIIQANGASSRSRRNSWVFFLVLLGTVIYIVYDSRDDLWSHYYAHEYLDMHELLAVLFPVFFLLLQLKKIRERRKFGDTPVVMNPFPALVGDAFSAYVEINKKTDGLQFSAELLLMQNIDFEETDQDGHAVSRLDIVWKMSVTLYQERAARGIRLLLNADIPAGKPPSQPSTIDNYYSWCLYIYSKDKSFKRKWNIPIITSNDYI